MAAGGSLLLVSKVSDLKFICSMLALTCTIIYLHIFFTTEAFFDVMIKSLSTFF